MARQQNTQHNTQAKRHVPSLQIISSKVGTHLQHDVVAARSGLLLLNGLNKSWKNAHDTDRQTYHAQNVPNKL